MHPPISHWIFKSLLGLKIQQWHRLKWKRYRASADWREKRHISLSDCQPARLLTSSPSCWWTALLLLSVLPAQEAWHHTNPLLCALLTHTHTHTHTRTCTRTRTHTHTHTTTQEGVALTIIYNEGWLSDVSSQGSSWFLDTVIFFKLCAEIDCRRCSSCIFDSIW